MELPLFASITLILSPYHVGVRCHGVGAGPVIKDIGILIHVFEIELVDNFEGEIGRGF